MLYPEELNGVFETMRAYNGRMFMLEEHITRLLESSKTSGIKISLRRDALKAMLKSALKKKGYKDAYIRFAVYADKFGRAKYHIVVKEAKIYPKTFYTKGVCVVTAATRRSAVESQNPKIKSSCFLNGILAKIEGLEHFESIMLNRKGLITEGSVSNIFIVKDRKIFTPPTHLGVLCGITRNVVLRLAKKKGIGVYENPFTRHELFNADECFLTNTSMEVMPVVNCDGRKIGNGKPGLVTNMLKDEFIKMLKRGDIW
ncbi:MAG: hypothetical protein AMJ78_03180 [Omnitrophica WOR_2 bacterium SM23_29]|nr:MAG: hypothetical protein AMJ78_03180 [Omnitrophica WOR_2 bacterium SM23_29]